MNGYLPNDGRFPDDSDVWTPYPLTDDNTNRDEWPWVRGSVLGQGDSNEWHIAIEVPELIEHEDGVEWRPACFRNSCELRLVTRRN